VNQRLFGTDGIRGRAFEPPLDEDTVRRLGGALADSLGGRHARPEILLAGDTRRSTERLAGWLAGSFQACGGAVTWGASCPRRRSPNCSDRARGPPGW
jgi:phosphomannomutase